LMLDERLAADPVVLGAGPQPPSTARFAVLADQEKAFPRLGDQLGRECPPCCGPEASSVEGRACGQDDFPSRTLSSRRLAQANSLLGCIAPSMLQSYLGCLDT